MDFTPMLGARDASGPRGGLVTTPLAGVSADEAVLHLRRKIGQRLKSGPYGLQRCWMQFRERSGGTKEGITYAEFCHGLKNYDVIVTDAVSREVFDRMDKNGDGHIQITEFVNHVMGRWSAETNTIVDQHVRAGHGKNLDESPLDLTADEARAARMRKAQQRKRGALSTLAWSLDGSQLVTGHVDCMMPLVQ